MNIPKTMKVLELSAYHSDQKEALQSLAIATRPVPEPGPGEILIKMEGAPCNPSDLLFVTGSYNFTKTLPCVPGFEGAGIIVKKGKGFSPWLKVGARVACGGQADREGTWAEYFVTDATSCLPLKKELPVEQAPFMLINPLTAMAMLDVAKAKGARAIVQSAAASQLGQMLIQFAKQAGVETINIVRRQAQVDLLKSQGAKHVLNSTDPNFKQTLTDLAAKLKATVALDAISGNFTGILVDALPNNSEIILYGTLGGQYMGDIYSRAFSYGMKTLSGFNLKVWSDSQGMLKKLRLFGNAQKLVSGGQLKTTIQATVGFEKAGDALVHYSENMTDGKVLIKP